ncbi:hypothetical protein BGW80DRAFT_1454507 [Lactifluus volemus]|nr:hypothetical protein BGW80DRAFT_1454507 [Lactifluus volemus]
MDFLSDLSPSAHMPVFNVHINNESAQKLFQQELHDDVNHDPFTLSAAGSVTPPPLPSTCQPTQPIYNFKQDQLDAFFNTYFFTNTNAGRHSGALDSNHPVNDDFQDLGLSSSPSSPPPSSLTSPLGEDVPLPLTSQEQLLFLSPCPLSSSNLGVQDLDIHAQAYQYTNSTLFSPTGISPPSQPLLLSIPLPDVPATADVLNIAAQGQQGIGIDDLTALQGNCLAAPGLTETTTLGLYYPMTFQGPKTSPLFIQVENNASLRSSFERAPPAPSAAESRKVRAVGPASKKVSKRAGRDKTRPSDSVTTTSSGTSTGTKVNSVLKCKDCGFSQSTQRKGDFKRHLKTHSDKASNRYVCCGIPVTHWKMASLLPEYTVRSYKGCDFYGGCGKSYSRMDALQRHLGKSHCAGGSAKEHEIWRELYL